MTYSARQTYYRPSPSIISFILATLMVYSVVGSAIEAQWVQDLGLLNGVMIGALLVGLLFAGTRSIPGWLAHVLMLVVGTIWIVAQIGPTLDPNLHGWRDYAVELILRLIAWERDFESGFPSDDATLFLLLLSATTWLLSYV